MDKIRRASSGSTYVRPPAAGPVFARLTAARRPRPLCPLAHAPPNPPGGVLGHSLGEVPSRSPPRPQKASTPGQPPAPIANLCQNLAGSPLRRSSHFDLDPQTQARGFPIDAFLSSLWTLSLSHSLSLSLFPCFPLSSPNTLLDICVCGRLCSVSSQPSPLGIFFSLGLVFRSTVIETTPLHFSLTNPSTSTRVLRPPPT